MVKKIHYNFKYKHSLPSALYRVVAYTVVLFPTGGKWGLEGGGRRKIIQVG